MLPSGSKTILFSLCDFGILAWMFLEPEGTIFGQLGRAATVHLCPHWQVTLVAAPQIEGSHVLPFMESFLPHVSLELKAEGRKVPQVQLLLPISVFRRRGPLPFPLNICLGWRSAGCGALGESCCVCCESFSLKGDQSGFRPITGMFTPTHLDRPSIYRRRWRDHVIRTRVSSLSNKTMRKCPTEGLSVWQIGQGHLENKEDNPNSLIIIPILPIIFDTGKNLKGWNKSYPDLHWNTCRDAEDLGPAATEAKSVYSRLY